MCKGGDEEKETRGREVGRLHRHGHKHHTERLLIKCLLKKGEELGRKGRRRGQIERRNCRSVGSSRHFFNKARMMSETV